MSARVNPNDELIAWAAGLADEPRSVAVACERAGLVRLGPWLWQPPLEEAAIGRALHVGVHVCDEGRTGVRTATGVGAGVVAAAVGAAIASGKALALAERALGTLRYNGWGRGEWWMRELGGAPAGGAVARCADENAERLAFDRIPLDPPAAFGFTAGLIGPVDGEGRRDVRLEFRNVRGQADHVRFRLREGEGIEGVSLSVEGEDGDLRDRRQARRRFPGFAPCTVDLARELVADALVAHIAAPRLVPATFFLARPYLGPRLLEPRRRRPGLARVGLESLPLDGATLRETSRALESRAFGLTAALEDAWAAATAYVDAAVEREGRRKEVPMAKPLNDHLERGLTPSDRDRLLARLAANLEVEALAGRERAPATVAAARAYVALRDRRAPMKEISYVRWLLAAVYLAAQRHGRRPATTRCRGPRAAG